MTDKVPTIDLGDALTGHTAARSVAAREIDLACRTSGFFIIVGHGVPDDLLDAVIEHSREFFHLPRSEKDVVAPPGSEHFRGFLGLDTTALAATLGEETPPDLCESFNVSRFDDPVVREQARQPGADAIFHPNLWPDRPAGLRPAFEAYFAAMEALSRELLGLIGKALSLPEGWFDSKFEEPTSLLLVNWYPPVHGEIRPNQLRRGAHTDYGAFTIVATEPLPGLQISLDGIWKEVPPVSGGYVVNLGDLMARWTNDRWVSTLHRVVIPGDAESRGRDRISVPFFHQPTYTANIETIPTTISSDKPATYQPVVSGEWITEKSMSMLEG